VQTARETPLIAGLDGCAPPDVALYTAMRQSVPIIDAALDKIVRLAVGFSVKAQNPACQKALDEFARSVRVGAASRGLQQFVCVYLDSLLTYGNAVGEIVLTRGGDDIAALYNASLKDIRIKRGASPLETVIEAGDGVSFTPVRYPELVLFTPLNPPAGEIMGVPLLRSLPFVCGILLKIFNSVGVNFQRVANLRYAVTYKPAASSLDRAHAKEIAEAIAVEWQSAMQSSANGSIRDFVAVGDVDIKVIGAENQMIDTEIPVRQMLEQIVAKLGIPPFMLGLHWSSTERMSAQQADILTSELESYRRALTPTITRICELFLRLRGSGRAVEVIWDDINLQDEVQAANARLLNARIAQLQTQETGGGN
jgi:hypothetical protein